MTLKTDVGRKLFKIKYIINNHSKRVKIKNTDKNTEAKDKFDYEDEEIIEEINSLEAENFVKGAEADWDGSKGEVWIFGKMFKEVMFYIKIKIIKLDDGEELIIISFHPAERELRFPFV